MKLVKQLFLITLFATISSCTQASSKKKSNNPETHGANTENLNFIQEKITNNLYVLKSKDYNTNIGVFIGEKELLLIDPMAGINKHQNLLEAIQQLSKKPIKYVINTHSHMDHSGANSFFADLGATIILQENSRYSNTIYDTTFKDRYFIDMGNDTLELYHFTAHTFDDVLIYFAKNNTIFMGDTYMTNSFPHFYYGGGYKGHLEIVNKSLELGNDQTIIVPAHGKLTSNKQELTEYKKNTILWTNRIKELYDTGNTAEIISEDAEIKALSLTFNGTNKISQERLIQTIEKTISADCIETMSLSDAVLNNYEGTYTYENNQVDEVVFNNGKLFLRREGAYIYELLPLSETKFHIRGQAPYKHVTMNSSKNGFVFFNGKENLIANKQ